MRETPTSDSKGRSSLSGPLPHSAGTHLHRVRLASTRLAVGEDADIEAVYAGGDQGLHLLEHLRRGRGMEGVGLPGLLRPGPPTSSKSSHAPRPLSPSAITQHVIMNNRFTVEQLGTSKSLALDIHGNLAAEDGGNTGQCLRPSPGAQEPLPYIQRAKQKEGRGQSHACHLLRLLA